MSLSTHNRRMLSGVVAGAVALAAASACSRSDRANAGSDGTQTGAAASADSQVNASAQPNTATQPTTSNAPSADTTATPSAGTEDTSSRSAKAGHHHRRPQSSATRPTAGNEQDTAGYKAMAQDSSVATGNVSDSGQVSAAVSQPSDTSSVAATTDTAATTVSDTSADTMARDTSVALAQADTATIGDTGVILTRPDTTQQTEVAMGNNADSAAADTATASTTTADTAVMANDSTGQVAERVHADTVSEKAAELAKHDPARIRPPEDSTELHGNVTTDANGANADAAAVGAAGMASTGNIATGADAVAQMTRQSQQCVVAATDENRDVLWDMASSPSSLNPCGTGTMTLPKIWTGEKK
jgi:hypothetical protein